MVRSQSPSSSRPVSKSSWIIAAGVVVAAIYFGRLILIPFALSLVLSFLLTPFVSFLQKVHLGRIPSVLIVLTLAFGLTAVIGWGVTAQLLEITSNIRDYKANLTDKVRSLHSQRNAPIVQATNTVKELNHELAIVPLEATSKTNHSDGASRTDRPIPVQVLSPPSGFVQNMRSLLGPLSGPVETAVLVIVFMAFMLINREDLRNRLVRLGGQGQLTIVTQALGDASDRLSRYLLMQFLVNGAYGLLFGIGLYVIGVPHALLWGALGALLRFVPYVGTWIATAFPMALAAAIFPGWRQCLLTFGWFAVLELLVANVAEPWLYGSYTGISPFAILIAAVFWSTLWGPVGLILSTPLTLCLILVGRYVPEMSFLEVLLGDEPVLRPEELYYQRLLAMDQDEARNVAEQFLGEKSVNDFYESVLIPALHLAEEDRHSDVLGDHSSEFISQSTRELIEDLEERFVTDSPDQRADHRPKILSSNAAVVCVPARDEADELVGMMLTNILRRSSVENAAFLPIGTVDDMLDAVGRGAFDVACVSALPPFAVGQARSLCKRLQARFPNLKVVVGLWGFNGGVVKAQERVGQSCTDAVCTNLTEAVLQIHKLSVRAVQPNATVPASEAEKNQVA